MYRAEGNKIYYVWEEQETLFLTVHPTNSDISLEQQAVTLARVLNEMGGR